MSRKIHPTAIIDPSADIDPEVEIGAFCIVGDGVTIGAKTILHPGAKVLKNTRIGRECQIYSDAILGGPPQDHKYSGEQSFVIIGDHNIIREGVTIHRATGEGSATRIGDHNMLMAYAHIGHNCDIGSYVTIASYVGISGHVTVEDRATFGGICGVHQFCRIGTLAMIAGMAGVTQDIPPYMLASGRPSKVYDINKHGLRRAGILPKVRMELRDAYKRLYRDNLNTSQALEIISDEIPKSPELDHLLEFIRNTRSGANGRGNNATVTASGSVNLTYPHNGEAGLDWELEDEEDK